MMRRESNNTILDSSGWQLVKGGGRWGQNVSHHGTITMS